MELSPNPQLTSRMPRFASRPLMIKVRVFLLLGLFKGTQQEKQQKGTKSSRSLIEPFTEPFKEP